MNSDSKLTEILPTCTPVSDASDAF